MGNVYLDESQHVVYIVWFSLIYLFNGISTPYGLFNASIRFIRRWWIIMTTIYILNVPLQKKKKNHKQSFKIYLIIKMFGI